MDPSPIPRVKRGEPIRAADWNAIVTALGTSRPPLNGTGFGVQFTTEFAIAAYSVFTLVAPSDFGAVVTFTAAKMGDKGATPLLFTNGPVAVPADGQGVAAPIFHGDVAELTYDTTAPSIGYPCGPKPATVLIDTKGAGLVCVAAPYQTRVRVLRATGEPLIGKITAQVNGRATYATALASGTARVYCRNSTGVLVAATDPKNTAAATFDVPVYGLGRNALHVGQEVAILPVPSVGLMAMPVDHQLWCQTTSIITAASGGTLGTGTAEWYARASGVLSASGVTISVEHGGTTSIASGKRIIASIVDGGWAVTWEAC